MQWEFGNGRINGDLIKPEPGRDHFHMVPILISCRNPTDEDKIGTSWKYVEVIPTSPVSRLPAS